MIFSGLMIPFLGTTLGAGMVFFMKGSMNQKLEKMLLGFAAGVMIAASVWSLLIPSIEMTEQAGGIAWIPACVGFLLGMIFLLLLDSVIPHLHLDSDKPEGPKTKLGKSAMLVLAVTLHNIPEGMAVGLSLAIAAESGEHSELLAGMILAVGVALQNIPEGAAVSLPLRQEGMSAKRAFLYGTASGIVEPVAGMLTAVLLWVIHPMLPWFLSFAAGAMIFVVAEELIPEAHQKMGKSSHLATWGVMIGFTLMMILDVALG